MPQTSSDPSYITETEPEQGGSWRVSPVRIIGTVLSLGLLVLLMRGQGWEEFLQVLRRLPAHYFWIALAMMFGSRISVGLRWYVLLRSAEVKIGLWQCMRLVFMGLFASNFLPTTIGGDIVRMAGAVSLRADPGVSAASLILDRLIGMAGMSALAPVGLAIILRSNAAQTGVPPVPFVLVGGIFRGLEKIPGAAWLMRKGKRAFESIRRSAALWMKRPGSLLLALFFTFGHMLFTFMIIYLLLEGMHQPLSFWWVAGLWSLSYFVTLIPVSINGLGLQELSISLLYSKFGGVSTEAGLALALLWRMLPLLASLPGVLFLPEILRPLASMRKPKTLQEKHR